MSYEDAKRKKRFAIIGVSSILLVAMVVAVTVGVGMNKDGESDDIKKQKSESSPSMKAIKSICQPTDYKQTCETSLEKTAGNTTDPKELLKAAFKAAEKHINEAAKKSVLLQELEKDPRTCDALSSCKELMNMSIGEFRHSFDQVSELDFSLLHNIMADLKIWLSAAITYQETCLDGFQNTTTDAGKKMKNVLKTAMELSSNGMDIVTQLSSVLTSLGLHENSRRLLQAEDDNFVNGDNFPTWVDMQTRRLLSTQTSEINFDISVAKDGSGDFSTIREAVEQIPKKSNKTFVIHVKTGIYDEHLQFNKSMTTVLLIGDGSSNTVITGNKSFVDGINTFHTATVVVNGDHFMAKNIGFENSAGAIKHQAVALRVSGDYAIFYNCSMDGYQDTLYVHTKRQFYRDCIISGTIDFVFGDAAVVFQNCQFLVRKPLDNQQCIVTAQGRKQRRQPTAIIIQNSTIAAHPELLPVKDQVKSYLGRPWKEFSRTIIMESFIDDLIAPEGWLPWFGTFGLKTCWYTEFGNYGPGSDKKARVTWNGIKTITRQHANDFTPGRFLRGETWIKPTGVPYVPYLTRK